MLSGFFMVYGSIPQVIIHNIENMLSNFHVMIDLQLNYQRNFYISFSLLWTSSGVFLIIFLNLFPTHRMNPHPCFLLLYLKLF